MPQTIQIKRGLNANFSSVNLLSGEPAFVTDTGKLYVGDGTTRVLINPTYGTAANANTGTASGNVPVLDANGKLVAGVIPAMAISETHVVATQTAMLALSAQSGDIAIRTDINTTFILQGEPATNLANWIKILTPETGVISINGSTGAVLINGTNIVLPSYAKAATYAPIVHSDTVNVALGKLERRTDGFATLSSPSFTGTVTAPTPSISSNDTTVATTAYVKGQGFLTTAPVTSVNTKVGAVVIIPADIAMTGYTTGTSAAAIAATDTLSVAIGKLEFGKAGLASPSFTGTPVAPTATAGTNTTQLATTAFVQTAMSVIDGGTF